MRDQSVGAFLDAMAQRVPTPGGGASAGLHAAQAAALLAMVARYSSGPAFAAHAASLSRILATAEELRAEAVRLAEDDIAVFGAVGDAVRLPQGGDAARQARSAAISSALAAAAVPPAAIVEVAEKIVGLAEQLLPIGNRKVISDVAVAAEAARAAAGAGRLNVEINLGGITDAEVRRRLSERAAMADDVLRRADAVTAHVRALIGDLTTGRAGEGAEQPNLGPAVHLFRIVVDGETFDVADQGGSIQYSWISGPNPGYGIAVRRSDGAAPTEEEARETARSFLTSIDPATGYVAD